MDPCYGSKSITLEVEILNSGYIKRYLLESSNYAIRHWKITVRDTRLSYFILPARGFIAQAPLVLLSIVSGSEVFIGSTTLLLVTLGIWNWFEFGIRSAYTQKIIEKNKKEKSKTNLMGVFIVGLPESTPFFGLAMLSAMVSQDTHYLQLAIMPWFVVILLSPILIVGYKLYYLSVKKYNDIRFLQGLILRTVQFTAPVLFISRSDSLHQQISPVSFPFSILQSSLIKNIPLVGVSSYLSTIIILLIAYLLLLVRRYF